MIFDQIVCGQMQGEAPGITSVCSAHPWVLKAALQAEGYVLIESTCNQVNQLGGYTGMTPADFVRFVHVIALENHFPPENIILGGDHLGPNVWKNEPADSAMQKAGVLVRDYVEAGFVKIHLDCSMRLADDPQAALAAEISARRAARLAKAAEASHVPGNPLPHYVIGSEVPIPGGATDDEDDVHVTRVEDAQQTIEITREAFVHEGLEFAWERVVAVVVQPGVEFGNDFILKYDPKLAQPLSHFIESHSMVYEAHSTDYQNRESLVNLVRDHFAILKVGPALTFAFREAVFSLACIEDEWLPEEVRSNLIGVMENVMVQNPAHWQKYLHGSPEQLSFARKYSLSDRIRYYWPYPQVQFALNTLLNNLRAKALPPTLLSQFLPKQYECFRLRGTVPTPESVILDHIREVLQNYQVACGSV